MFDFQRLNELAKTSEEPQIMGLMVLDLERQLKSATQCIEWQEQLCLRLAEVLAGCELTKYTKERLDTILKAIEHAEYLKKDFLNCHDGSLFNLTDIEDDLPF